MLQGLFVLLACQLIGEAVAHLLNVPVPGPVIGILVLIAYQAGLDRLAAGRPVQTLERVQAAGDGLLKYLGVMFIPAGVGVAQSYGLILAHGISLIATLVGSTVITLLVTVGVFRLAARLHEEES
ncbi:MULTISPECIES: CidA/LrgA family protein [unclassified Aureimonas]|uniref:CidA/LrgA family protein n=1 Tax=unclassified Aureimonas TaxID=2615206 RepID=UPI0006F724BF|nr:MULTISPECIES: CidA/LrgA family protein [unclassified Aureimonas]KQT62943.1 hypothetical protein ASG62_22815 [Aureimonas sp. Leaf427]KQT74820.1 hypothetical protein ASG54_16355 [Aureimonas sp. Leaf460]